MKMGAGKIYVLDTSVLLHDPDSLFRFGPHDIFVPLTVLGELNRRKRGPDDASRAAREVLRTFGRLMERAGGGTVTDGLPLEGAPAADPRLAATGSLHFRVAGAAGSDDDGDVLQQVLRLGSATPRREVVLVTKVVELRVRATLHGIAAVDYAGDRLLCDASLLYSGSAELPADFKSRHTEIHSWETNGRIHHELTVAASEDWYPNQCLYMPGDGGLELRVTRVAPDKVTMVAIDDYRRHGVWGMRARNRQQNFALNVLMDPDVDLVTLEGPAGSGKTLLALAAGLAQVRERQRYREIWLVRATVSPGGESGARYAAEISASAASMLADAVELLSHGGPGRDWEDVDSSEVIGSCIKLRSLHSLGERTFRDRYIIVDEAQNLTPRQLSLIVDGAGTGSKLVCVGNLKRVENPYLDETTSGLTFAVERFKSWPHAAHVTLEERMASRLAAFSLPVAVPNPARPKRAAPKRRRTKTAGRKRVARSVGQ